MRRAIAALILALPIVGTASELPPPTSDDTTLDVALHFGKSKTVFRYADGNKADTMLKWFGASWYERVASRWEIGIFADHMFLTQTDRAASAGLEPDGYRGGVSVRGVLLDVAAVQLFVDAAYAYARVHHESSGQSLVLAWEQPHASLGLASRAFGPLRVSAGVTWETIDGQERVNANTSRTTDFDRHHRSGGFIDIDAAVENDGYVGAALRAGTERGGEIYFKKRF